MGLVDLIFMYPLISEVKEGGLAILRDLAVMAVNDLAPSFSTVGKGIGALFLLVVIVYYISELHNGGKFQMKMLMPLLIFFFVCNFTWIAKPVVGFTYRMTEALIEQCSDKVKDIKSGQGLSSTAILSDLKTQRDNENDTNPVISQELQEESRQSQPDSSDIITKSPSGLQGIIHRGIDNEVQSLAENAEAEMTGTPDVHRSPQMSTFMGLISVILSFVCVIVRYALMAIGGVMTALIVAFGPITFAFAIFPGQAGTIKTWFIRLCQFSLYGPLASLVDCFSWQLTSLWCGSSGPVACLQILAVALCTCVVLTSIPSIASMIIEGAQGAISLSQGLQTMTSVMGGVATLVMGKNRMKEFSEKANAIDAGRMLWNYFKGGGGSGGAGGGAPTGGADGGSQTGGAPTGLPGGGGASGGAGA